jgi:putative membrane protein insertion efficiency factor
MTNFNNIFGRRSLGPRRSESSRSAQLILHVISWYQKARAGRIAPCRFYPSCSHYAYEAVQLHGALRGTGFALRRLSKCRPFGPQGIDLVPATKKVRTTTP